jgi:hypothetical protein
VLADGIGGGGLSQLKSQQMIWFLTFLAFWGGGYADTDRVILGWEWDWGWWGVGGKRGWKGGSDQGAVYPVMKQLH